MGEVRISSTDVQRGWRSIQRHLDRGDEVVVTFHDRPVALITAWPQEQDPDAGATTEYGTWYLLMRDGTDTPETYVRQALGDTNGFEVDAIVDEFRTAINELLPEGVALHGAMIYGPYRERDDYLADIDQIRDAVVEIDYWGIAARHERDRRIGREGGVWDVERDENGNITDLRNAYG